ncbi:MAG: hypothetical protein ABSB25_07650 [Sedimentisphaerales bacterium]
MPARIATQTFQEAGGKTAYPNLDIIGIIRKIYITSNQIPPPSSFYKGKDERQEYIANLKRGGIYCDSEEEAYDKFAAVAEKMGYTHVFSVKMYEDDGRTILMGDGYGPAGTA